MKKLTLALMIFSASVSASETLMDEELEEISCTSTVWMHKTPISQVTVDGNVVQIKKSGAFARYFRFSGLKAGEVRAVKSEPVPSSQTEVQASSEIESLDDIVFERTQEALLSLDKLEPDVNLMYFVGIDNRFRIYAVMGLDTEKEPKLPQPLEVKESYEEIWYEGSHFSWRYEVFKPVILNLPRAVKRGDHTINQIELKCLKTYSVFRP